MVKAEDKKLARVQAMKAWVSRGIAPLIINLASDPLQPMLGNTAVNIGYHCHK
jgi:hypothetical protein